MKKNLSIIYPALMPAALFITTDDRIFGKFVSYISTLILLLSLILYFFFSHKKSRYSLFEIIALVALINGLLRIFNLDAVIQQLEYFFDVGQELLLIFLFIIFSLTLILFIFISTILIMRGKSKRKYIFLLGVYCIIAGTFILYGVSSLSILLIEARLTFVLIPLIIGWVMSEKRKLESFLLLLSFIPIWMNFPTDLLHLFIVQDNGDALMNLGTCLWIILPAVCFFIFIPIGIINARNDKEKNFWLLIPSAFILLVLYFLRELIPVLSGNGSSSSWSFSLFIVALSYFPLLLSSFVYFKKDDPKELLLTSV